MFLRKYSSYILLLLLASLCLSCSTKKNTKFTRFYHGLTTRFNVYFNGNEAYKEAHKESANKSGESYSQIIPMYTVSLLPKDKAEEGGPYTIAVEKGMKAIKEHSIKAKPKKKAGKSKDKKYQEFMSRNEYNPFIHNAWTLMGRAQFQNGDFLAASATFAYIARLYRNDKNLVAEARLWQARCYAELGWFYETEDILSKINDQNLPTKHVPLFSTVYADYLLKNERHQEAIPYLVKAIGNEKNKAQKARMRYLLGQLYTEEGNTTAAYNVFQAVIRSSPPFELEFNARIRQTEVYADVEPQKIIKKLNRMAKSDKNKDYLDQVYYALGNVYMSQKDTITAIEKYELALESSTRNGIDKAICALTLGELYFNMRNYMKAQPCYTEALNIINDKYKNYANIQKRSIVLDELVVHAEAVELQDSLQRLSKMPEEERMAVIQAIIAQVIKEEEEQKREAAMQDYMAQQGSRNPGVGQGGDLNMANMPAAMTMGGESSWYFYNPQTVASGKNTFQSKWGRRKLEDNWRRRDKKMNIFAEEEAEETEETADTTEATDMPEGEAGEAAGGESDAPPVELSTDNKDPQFYLQQIPFTEEDIAASDAIIEDGIFNMASIYKDKLEDFELAADAFNTVLTRFPDTETRLEIYYQMWLLYMRAEDEENADIYKEKILTEFTESDYAATLADPNYVENIRNMPRIQEDLYQSTYGFYLDNQVDSVRSSVNIVKLKYPLTPLMPKFLFVNALTYVMSNEPLEFKNALQDLVEKFPEADVTALANDYLKGLLKGRQIVSDLAPSIGMRWNLRFGGEDVVADSTLTFSATADSTYSVLLIYPDQAIHTNNLIFEVAGFNFANFTVKEIDLGIEVIGDMRVLNISGFGSFDDALHYDDLIYGDKGYARLLPTTLFAVIISGSNYEVLQKGKTLEDYFIFFEENYATIAPEVLARWQRNIDANNRLLEGDTDEDEQLFEDEAIPEGKAEDIPAEEPQQEAAEEVEELQLPDIAPETENPDSTNTPAEVIDAETSPEMEPQKIPVSKEPEVIFRNQEDPARKVREQQALLKQLEKEEAEKLEAEKAAKKEQEKEKKRREKEREKEQKQKDKDRAQQQKEREQERKTQQAIKDKERKTLQQQREVERKEADKQRDAERKQRELDAKRQKEIDAEKKKELDKERNLLKAQQEAAKKQAVQQREQEKKAAEQKKKDEQKQRDLEAKKKKELEEKQKKEEQKKAVEAEKKKK